LKAAVILALLLLMPAGASGQQRPVPASPAAVAPVPPERPVPYEPQLLRLAEIMGSLAHLAALCDPPASNDRSPERSQWRDQAAELLEAEGTTPMRKERIAGAYNRGFRGWQIMHRRCTDTARLAIQRHLAEGQRLARDHRRRVPVERRDPRGGYGVAAGLMRYCSSPACGGGTVIARPLSASRNRNSISAFTLRRSAAASRSSAAYSAGSRRRAKDLRAEGIAAATGKACRR